MKVKSILVTGPCGEIGQALLGALSNQNSNHLISYDLKLFPEELKDKSTHYIGDIRDRSKLEELFNKHNIDVIFHLAATLSSAGEQHPFLAHEVNTEGTIILLKLASEYSQLRNEVIKFIFPSSIAVYGLPNLATKNANFYIKENEWVEPITMYGCTKLYCENVGRYISKKYIQYEVENHPKVDFRALRFPGLISAYTVPSGGTSDFGPEMIRAAAKGEEYRCFVGPDVRIPFMAMPDATKAILMLAEANGESLSRYVYNVTSFSSSAYEYKEKITNFFADSDIRFYPDEKRQIIVDSWPADLDDSAARSDWGWVPDYDKNQTFMNYLFPNIREKYRSH